MLRGRQASRAPLDPKHLPPSGTLQAGRYPSSGRCDLVGWSLAFFPTPGSPPGAVKALPPIHRRSDRTHRLGRETTTRHASWPACSSHTRAACQVTPDWLLLFSFQGPTNRHSCEGRTLHATLAARRLLPMRGHSAVCQATGGKPPSRPSVRGSGAREVQPRPRALSCGRPRGRLGPNPHRSNTLCRILEGHPRGDACAAGRAFTRRERDCLALHRGEALPRPCDRE